MVSDSLNRIKGKDVAKEYVRAIKECSVTAFAGNLETFLSFLFQTDMFISAL